MNNEENYDSDPGKHTIKIFPEALGYLNNTLPADEIPPIDVLIKQERTKKEISQKELAKNGDVTNIQISRIERGECNPSVRTLVRLAPYLGYPLEILLIASHYRGNLPTVTPTYIDLDGRVIDLEQAVQSMYQIDGELLLLMIDFYKNYTLSEGKLLKILLKSIAECRNTNTEAANTVVPDEDKSNKKVNSSHRFAEAFSNLKQFIFSFDKLVHETAN